MPSASPGLSKISLTFQSPPKPKIPMSSKPNPGPPKDHHPTIAPRSKSLNRSRKK